MRVVLRGVGIAAPGLIRWDQAAPVLAGAEPYAQAALVAPPALGLAPNERRRAGLATRLALEAARQATGDTSQSAARAAPEATVGGSDDPATQLLSVFASSDGDMTLIERMCSDIYRAHTAPSPTVFQNSVHNAVSGYWSIAAGCRQPTTSIAAGDGTFAAGLIEAAVQVETCRKALLLVAFDVPAPPILHPHRSFSCAFACALLLAPAAAGAPGPELRILLDPGRASQPPARRASELCRPCDDGGLTALSDPELEAMRRGNPAARALPLLAAVAAQRPSAILLPYWPGLPLGVHLGYPAAVAAASGLRGRAHPLSVPGLERPQRKRQP